MHARSHSWLDKRNNDTEDHCNYTVYSPGLYLHYTNVLIACWYSVFITLSDI